MKQQRYEAKPNLGTIARYFHMQKNQEFPPLLNILYKVMGQKLLWWWIIHHREPVPKERKMDQQLYSQKQVLLEMNIRDTLLEQSP